MVPSLLHVVFTIFLAEDVYCWYHLNLTEYHKYADDSQISNPNIAEEQLDRNANVTEEQWINNSATKETSGIDDLYIDFRRIGFQIFVQKLIEGLRILRYILEIDSPVVKFTDLYTHVNETINNYNNSSNLTSGTTNKYFDYLNYEHLEKTTGSSLKNHPTENPLERETEKIKEMRENTENVQESKVLNESQPTLNDSVKENEINIESEDVVGNKPEDGFFSNNRSHLTSGTSNKYSDYLSDEHYIEMTTGSPLKNNPTENPLEKETEKIREMKESSENVQESKGQNERQPLLNDSVKANEKNIESEDVEKKSEGFFSSVINQVDSIFHSFTNWFKNIVYKLF